ncbi:Flp/Fap pilin component [compost metagenome]
MVDFIKDEDGLTMVEYAVAGSLVAAATVVAFGALGTKIGLTIDFLASKMVSQ